MTAPTAHTRATLITGAAILGGERRDLAIVDGALVDPTTIDRDSADVVDASGLIALPGLVDLHTHLRQPGGEQAETVATGVRAAAAGGYTCVFAMANTNPVADTRRSSSRCTGSARRPGSRPCARSAPSRSASRGSVSPT